jgi:nucleoside-diphosphate-sugar epimerase
MHPRVIVVLGARGRLGSAIVAALPPGTAAAPDRPVYVDWSRPGTSDTIARALDRMAGHGGTVIVASGVIDPSLSRDVHEAVNYALARNVVEGAAKAGVRAVTVGTVMESLVAPEAGNPYVASKQRLSDFIAGFDAGDAPQPLHVRIHTLYGGGPPTGFMFLGQMFAALSSRTSFCMSSGRQLREYHHVADDADALLTLVRGKAGGIVALSHGRPVMLKALAEAVFDAFGATSLVTVGALPDPPADNYAVAFPANPHLTEVNFRETLPNVILYLRSCLEPANAHE